MGDIIISFLIKFILYIGLPCLVIYLVYRMISNRKKVMQLYNEQFKLMSIMVPKNNEKTPLAAEQMLASLHGILKPAGESQPYLSFEVASQNKFTQFYIYVPQSLVEFVEGQIFAQYPNVDITEVEDYTHVNLDNLAIAGTELTLTKEDVYPIKTFQNFEVDPLAGITSVLSNVSGEERVWIQILTQPVDDSWKDRGEQLVKNIRGGYKPGGNIFLEIFNHAIGIIMEVPKHLISPPSADANGKKDSGKDEAPKLSGPQETAMTGIETKVQKLGFSTKIRLAAIAANEETAKAKLMGIVGVFKQFNTTNLNGFSVGNIVTDADKLLPIFQTRPYGEGGDVFNIEELASLYHFPHMTVETPAIVWAGSKKGEPPANLPVPSLVPADELTVYAETNYRHMRQSFGIKKKDRRLHVYTVGKTGTGKTNLLQNMIIDDIREGRGVAVVDPHGDLTKHVLNFVPEERIQDVVYFNPADGEFPIGFNLLENVEADLKNIVASGLMTVFKKIWPDVWSARMEYIFRNCVLALLEYPGATFLGIMKLLSDKEYRSKVVENVKDPVIRDFFLNEYERYDPKFRNEAIAPIQNKVGQFLSATTVRNIVGQAHSTIDVRDIMDTAKILLIDLSIGKIGEDNSALLGAMMITKMQLTAMGRTDQPEDERRDFYLYVDEFQNFATDSFAIILSEARKYHLNLILTNQYIAQLGEVVAAAIFGNIGTMISFRVGATDADSLVKEFEPVFDANDLVNLDNYHIYVKMAIDGVTCPAFSAVTLPPSKDILGNKDAAIEFSRRTYGRPRDAVEEEIGRVSVVTEETEETKEPLQIGKQIYKENSAKGGVKWFLYDRDEDEAGEAEEEKPEFQGEEAKEKENEKDKQTEKEHLITLNEAHDIAHQTFEPAGDNTVMLNEGEITQIKKD